MARASWVLPAIVGTSVLVGAAYLLLREEPDGGGGLVPQTHRALAEAPRDRPTFVVPPTTQLPAPPPVVGASAAAEALRAASARGEPPIVGRGAASARVTVRDWRGQPVPGAVVVVMLETAENPTSMVARAHADDQGLAVLEGLAAENAYTLVVRALGGRREDAPARLVAWRPAATSVDLPRGYIVRGMVRDLQGRPVEYGGVMRKDPDGKGWTGNLSDAEGKFEIDQLLATPIGLKATLTNRTGPLTTVLPGTPQADAVTLLVDVGLIVRIRVEGWSLALSTQGDVTLDGQHVSPNPEQTLGINPDGSALLRGLEEEQKFILFIPSRDGKQCVYERGLRSDAGTLTVSPQPAASVSGKIIGPPELRDIRVTATGPGLKVSGKVSSDRGYVIDGLPEGTWNVWASGRIGENRIDASTRGTTGSPQDVEFYERR